MAPEAKVIIYTAPSCGYCSAAKNLFRSKGIQFEEIDLGSNPELRQQVMERSGRRTVPQIFVADQSLGGYDDVAALNKSGELDRLLAAHNLVGKGSAS